MSKSGVGRLRGNWLRGSVTRLMTSWSTGRRPIVAVGLGLGLALTASGAGLFESLHVAAAGVYLDGGSAPAGSAPQGSAPHGSAPQGSAPQPAPCSTATPFPVPTAAAPPPPTAAANTAMR